MCNTYSKCKCCQHLFLRVTTTSLRRVCTVTSLRCLPASLSSLILSTHTLRAFDWHPIHKFEPNKITLVRINCNELHGYLTCIICFSAALWSFVCQLSLLNAYLCLFTDLLIVHCWNIEARWCLYWCCTFLVFYGSIIVLPVQNSACLHCIMSCLYLSTTCWMEVLLSTSVCKRFAFFLCSTRFIL